MAEYLNEFNRLRHITAKLICKYQKFSEKTEKEQDTIKNDINKINHDLNSFKNKIDQNNKLILQLIEQLKNKDNEYNEKFDNLNDKIDSLNLDKIYDNIECFPKITNELFPTFGKTIYFNENKGNFLYSNFGHIKKLLANSFTNVSDKKLKNHIKPLKNSLNKIKKLKGVSYKWKDPSINNKKNIGFIAQDVQKIIPEIVNKTDNNILGIEYDKLTPLLVESIKELDEKINNYIINKNYNQLDYFNFIFCFIFIFLLFFIFYKLILHY